MSILPTLFGGVFAPKKFNIPFPNAGAIQLPTIKQTRRQRATHQVADTLLNSKRVAVCREEYRELERNKYAPWGRGEHSGLPR
jgi:hypothetical protein